MARVRLQNIPGLDQPFAGDRSAAKAAGARFYTGGRPCKHGHIPTIRYTNTASCVICRSLVEGNNYAQNRSHRLAHAKDYASRNKERIAERQRKHRLTNLPQRRIWKRDWVKRNVEHVYNYQKEWTKAHPEDVRAHNKRQKSRRRAQKFSAGGSHTKAQILALYKRQKGKCGWCGIKLNGKYHEDHIIPLCDGGTDHISNIIISCGPCNLSKNKSDPIDWVRKKFGKLL